MKIKLTTLTPVFIGSGEIASPVEYVSINENGEITEKLSKFLCKIQIEKLLKDASFTPFFELFIKYAPQQRYIGSFLKNSPFEKSFKSLLLKYVSSKIPISESAEGKNPININLFVKSARRVYIPGSSLKGSILSAVIYHILTKKKITQFEKFDDILKEVIEDSSKIKNNKFSRWLNVIDSDLKEPEECLEISYVEVTGGRRKGIPLLYETLKPNMVFFSEIKTSVNSFYPFGNFTVEEILKIADEFYRKIYKKFNYSFSIPEEGYLLRIGQGSSVLSTSLLIPAEELGISQYSIKRRNLPPLKPGELPRTQKLVGGRVPMGWVSVNIEDK